MITSTGSAKIETLMHYTDDGRLRDELYDAIAARLSERGFQFDCRPDFFSLFHDGHLLTIDGYSPRMFARVIMETKGPDRGNPTLLSVDRLRSDTNLLSMKGVADGSVDEIAAAIVDMFLRQVNESELANQNGSKPSRSGNEPWGRESSGGSSTASERRPRSQR